MKILLKLIKYAMLTIIAGFVLFAIARGVFCGPDKDVEKVALPLAKAIVEHIEKNGVPKALNEVEGLPYQLSQCTSNIYEGKSTDYETKRKYIDYRERTEQCFFHKKENAYNIRLRIGEGAISKRIGVYIDIEQKNTRVHYEIHSKKDNRWGYKFFPQGSVEYIHGTGFCKPQPLRLTQ